MNGAALTSRVQSFRTGMLAGSARINRELIGRAEALDSVQRVVLDMNSTGIRVYGQQEQSAYNAAARQRPLRRRTAEPWIQEGKLAVETTRLMVRRIAALPVPTGSAEAVGAAKIKRRTGVGPRGVRAMQWKRKVSRFRSGYWSDGFSTPLLTMGETHHRARRTDRPSCREPLFTLIAEDSVESWGLLLERRRQGGNP